MFAGIKNKSLEDERIESFHRRLHTALQKERIEGRMIPWMKEMMTLKKVTSTSCCEGHDPGWSSYVLMRVKDDYQERFEKVLREIVDSYSQVKVFAQRITEYRNGQADTRYAFRSPTEMIDEILPDLIERLRIMESS